MIVYELCDLLSEKLQEDERLLFAGFPGDPYDNASWSMCTYSASTRFFEQHNLYLCVGAARRNERGEFRRKKENISAGLFLMIDDLGDGLGSKNPLSIINKLEPTLLVETSPGNFQAIYVFDEPVRNLTLFESLINGFIAKEFIDGKDPGMRGINRVARMPFGINGKKKYGGWKVVGKNWKRENQYTPPQLIEAFGIVPPRPRKRMQRLVPNDTDLRIDIFAAVKKWLSDNGTLKKEEADLGGKIPMTCPWVHLHTDAADSGTYLALPSEENNFCGSFVCYHSSTHNDQTGWKMLLKYAIENSPEVRALLEQQELDIENALAKANGESTWTS